MAAAIAYTVQNESFAKQFDQLYSNATHGIGGYTSPSDGQEWISEIDLTDNYTLCMSYEITIDQTGRQTTRKSDPQFKVIVIEPLSTSGYKHLGSYSFGLKEWEQIVAADGDISVIRDEIESILTTESKQE